MNHNDYYGLTRFRIVSLTIPGVGWVSAASEDSDRVGLIVSGSDGNTVPVFTIDPNVTTSGQGVIPGSLGGGIDIQFPIHGALVCREWFVSDQAGVGGTCLVIETIMEIDPCDRHNGSDNAGFPVSRAAANTHLDAFNLKPQGWNPDPPEAIEGY